MGGLDVVRAGAIDRTRRLSLAQRFLLGSLAILLAGMLGVGFWVVRQIEDGVVQRTAATNALFVDSLVASPLQDLAERPSLSAESIDRLDWLLTGTQLGRQVALFRIFDTDGTIVYSSLTHQVGQQIPLDGEIEGALRGEVVAGLGQVEGDIAAMNLPAGDLLEIYSPVRRRGTSDVLAVAEFYFIAEDLNRDIAAAQRRSWLVVGGFLLAMYLMLAYFVQRASNVISRQQEALSHQVVQLREVLAQNRELGERVRGAAARTTALNERFLRRFSADLHDGPAQDISLALLRLDHVQAGGSTSGAGSAAEDDLSVVQESLQRALRDVRDTSTGLLLPELAEMSVAGTLDHAIRAHRRRTGVAVELVAGELPEQAPLATKIAAYRVVQEALTNAFRHAAGSEVRVRARRDGGSLDLEVSDSGPGFDPGSTERSERHLGLVGMRERVESLGGEFQIESSPDSGTDVIVRLPLDMTGSGYD